MMYTREMMKIMEANGYEVIEWVDGEADIFYKHRFIETVRGEWGLHNWMRDREMFEDD